jgi:hypothetical protein
MTDERKVRLLELAARCEQSAGADRKLDAEIHDAVGAFAWRDALPGPKRLTREQALRANAFRYSDSLDVALTLVPAGLHWTLWQSFTGFHGGYVEHWDGAEWHCEADTATPALALCAAALRAHAAKLDAAG